MEISLQVAKAPAPGQKVRPEDVVITCQCTMVSLDPATKKPVQIPSLRVETEEEKRLFDEGEKNSKRRKSLAQRSLLKQTPDDEESDLIHSIWRRQLQYHDPNGRSTTRFSELAMVADNDDRCSPKTRLGAFHGHNST